MTQLAPWLLMISGAILVTIGLFSGWNASGKSYLVLGMTCVIPAGAFLLQDSGSALGTPALILSAMWIIGILVATRNVSMRGVLRDARSELLFGGITAAALLMIEFLPASAPAAVRIALVVATSIFAVSFIVATAMRMRGSDLFGRSNH
jgi:hypothetical protein